ncbi:MAG: DUF6600 domain-containing protein [Sandaracinaceae bacterium]
MTSMRTSSFGVGSFLLAVSALLSSACGSVEYGSDEPTYDMNGGMVVYGPSQAPSAAGTSGGVAVPSDDDASAASGPEITISLFIRELAPYGDWLEDPQYGTVFIPSDPGYRPYRQGRWVVTEEGMAWVSDDAIGWALDHYGAWTLLDDGRWAWIPGTDWSPANVEWRADDTYVGWAPQIYGGTAPATEWVFVQSTTLLYSYDSWATVPYASLPTVYASCSPRRWRRGPSARWMARAGIPARAPIPTTRPGRGRAAAQGGRVTVRPGSLPSATGGRVSVARGTPSATGGVVRVVPSDVGSSSAGLREGARWVPRETVVLGGRPVPEHRGPGNYVVMPGPPAASAELHPVRPPVGADPRVTAGAPPLRFVGPRPRSTPMAPGPVAQGPMAQGPVAQGPMTAAPTRVPAPMPAPAPRPFIVAPRGSMAAPQPAFAGPAPSYGARPMPSPAPRAMPSMAPRPAPARPAPAPRVYAAPRASMSAAPARPSAPAAQPARGFSARPSPSAMPMAPAGGVRAGAAPGGARVRVR